MPGWAFEASASGEASRIVESRCHRVPASTKPLRASPADASAARKSMIAAFEARKGPRARGCTTGRERRPRSPARGTPGRTGAGRLCGAKFRLRLCFRLYWDSQCEKTRPVAPATRSLEAAPTACSTSPESSSSARCHSSCTVRMDRMLSHIRSANSTPAARAIRASAGLYQKTMTRLTKEHPAPRTERSPSAFKTWSMRVAASARARSSPEVKRRKKVGLSFRR